MQARGLLYQKKKRESCSRIMYHKSTKIPGFESAELTRVDFDQKIDFRPSDECARAWVGANQICLPVFLHLNRVDVAACPTATTTANSPRAHSAPTHFVPCCVPCSLLLLLFLSPLSDSVSNMSCLRRHPPRPRSERSCPRCVSLASVSKRT
jgi:hypothetical protein